MASVLATRSVSSVNRAAEGATHVTDANVILTRVNNLRLSVVPSTLYPRPTSRRTAQSTGTGDPFHFPSHQARSRAVENDTRGGSRGRDARRSRRLGALAADAVALVDLPHSTSPTTMAGAWRTGAVADCGEPALHAPLPDAMAINIEASAALPPNSTGVLPIPAASSDGCPPRGKGAHPGHVEFGATPDSEVPMPPGYRAGDAGDVSPRGRGSCFQPPKRHPWVFRHPRSC